MSSARARGIKCYVMLWLVTMSLLLDTTKRWDQSRYRWTGRNSYSLLSKINLGTSCSA